MIFSKSDFVFQFFDRLVDFFYRIGTFKKLVGRCVSFIEMVVPPSPAPSSPHQRFPIPTEVSFGTEKDCDGSGWFPLKSEPHLPPTTTIKSDSPPPLVEEASKHHSTITRNSFDETFPPDFSEQQLDFPVSLKHEDGDESAYRDFTPTAYKEGMDNNHTKLSFVAPQPEFSPEKGNASNFLSYNEGDLNLEEEHRYLQASRYQGGINGESNRMGSKYQVGSSAEQRTHSEDILYSSNYGYHSPELPSVTECFSDADLHSAFYQEHFFGSTSPPSRVPEDVDGKMEEGPIIPETSPMDIEVSGVATEGGIRLGEKIDARGDDAAGDALLIACIREEEGRVKDSVDQEARRTGIIGVASKSIPNVVTGVPTNESTDGIPSAHLLLNGSSKMSSRKRVLRQQPTSLCSRNIDTSRSSS